MPRDRLWAGFQGGGLFAETGRRFESVGSQRLISALCPAPDGSVWAGTRGNGLFRVAGSQEIHFGTENGLSSDIITAVAAQAGQCHSRSGRGRERCIACDCWTELRHCGTAGLAFAGAAISALLVGKVREYLRRHERGENLFRLQGTGAPLGPRRLPLLARRSAPLQAGRRWPGVDRNSRPRAGLHRKGSPVGLGHEIGTAGQRCLKASAGNQRRRLGRHRQRHLSCGELPAAGAAAVARRPVDRGK